MPDVKVLSGGGFIDQSVTSTTVEGLRNELNIDSSAAVSVNGRNVTNSTTVNDGDIVAAVSNNKTGGNNK